jgi:hypothetical protein
MPDEEKDHEYPVSPISDEDRAMIAKNFVYHAPKDDQPARYERLRGEARALATTLLRTCPPSRERSLALTNLEQAIFWANASIARS